MLVHVWISLHAHTIYHVSQKLIHRMDTSIILRMCDYMPSAGGPTQLSLNQNISLFITSRALILYQGAHNMSLATHKHKVSYNLVYNKLTYAQPSNATQGLAQILDYSSQLEMLPCANLLHQFSHFGHCWSFTKQWKSMVFWLFGWITPFELSVINCPDVSQNLFMCILAIIFFNFYANLGFTIDWYFEHNVLVVSIPSTLLLWQFIANINTKNVGFLW